MKCTSERRARKREIFSETENERKTVGWLVDWCFEPSQPHRAISGLRERQGRERERERETERERQRQRQRHRQTDRQRQRHRRDRDRDSERICAFEYRSNAHLTSSSFITATAS